MKNVYESNLEGVQELDAEQKSSLTHLDIAPGIIESIVAIAAQDVEGVASVGTLKVASSADGASCEQEGVDGVEFIADDGEITLELTIQIYTGYKVKELAEAIKSNVYEVLLSQTGISVKAININITGLQIENR